MSAAEIARGLVCLFKGHRWERRIIVPGKYCQAVTEVCTRCGKGEAWHQEAKAHYRAYTAVRTILEGQDHE